MISRSPTDIQPVFEAIVESAARLCEAEFSVVARFDEGLLHLVAMNNMSSEEAEAHRSVYPRPPTRDYCPRLPNGVGMTRSSAPRERC